MQEKVHKNRQEIGGNLWYKVRNFSVDSSELLFYTQNIERMYDYGGESMERWYCPYCAAAFDRPIRRWDYDDGTAATVCHRCPRCGAAGVERLHPCPTCEGGWRRQAEPVCEKCHLRHLDALRRFARSFSPAALADLDDMLDGTGLRLFL